jgi:hypothetical protein
LKKIKKQIMKKQKLAQTLKLKIKSLKEKGQNLIYGAIVAVSFVEVAIAMDKLKLGDVKASVFKDLTSMIDDNIALLATFSSVAAAAISQGDLRSRAQGAGVGLITAMLVWGMAKTVVGINAGG